MKMGMCQIKQPLAIAMWDFSWLLRHHKLGDFENWDKVLDGLVDRGYNAIRIDSFPQWVAKDGEGRIEEEIYCPKDNWNPNLWGNQYSVRVRPRQALLEFLPKCRERGIQVGLSSWFSNHGDGRNGLFTGVDGLVRAWDETLAFLNGNGLLENILYVDLLNEYPLVQGFNWLHRAMLADGQKVAIEDIELKHVGNEHIWTPDKVRLETTYHIQFLNQVIESLSDKWPNLDFFASLTPYGEVIPWHELADISRFAVLDMHLWFVQDREFMQATKYWELIHNFTNDMHFAEGYRLIREYWKDNREKQIDNMEQKINRIAETANKFSIPYGNTEGWGAVCWNDHPDLDWDFIKDAGEICAKLGKKHGFLFNCTSNFTHPQFPGLWNDVQWHRKVTSIIRDGY